MKALEVILIILVVLFILTYVIYITNADCKMIEKIYNRFISYHDQKETKEKV